MRVLQAERVLYQIDAVRLLRGAYDDEFVNPNGDGGWTIDTSVLSHLNDYHYESVVEYQHGAQRWHLREWDRRTPSWSGYRTSRSSHRLHFRAKRVWA